MRGAWLVWVAVGVLVRAAWFVWVGVWGVLGLTVWEPFWRDVFFEYTLDGGWVAGVAHAFGLVGFLVGVAAGVAVAGVLVQMGERGLIRGASRRAGRAD